MEIEKGRWFLCEDELPPFEVPIIAMYSGGCWFAGTREEDGQWFDGEYFVKEPDYWMIPKKPDFAPVKGKC